MMTALRHYCIVFATLLSLVFSFQKVDAQNTLDKAGLSSASSASAAYSFRKLSTSYAGFAANVRRSSDNAQANLSFDANGVVSASSNVTITVSGTSGLSVGAVLSFGSFYASTNCFITTWYDQSGGGRNAVQGNIANQPRIVNAGVLDMNNGKVAMSFQTNSNELTYTAGNMTVQTINAVRAVPVIDWQTVVAMGADQDFSLRFNGSSLLYNLSPNGNDWTYNTLPQQLWVNGQQSLAFSSTYVHTVTASSLNPATNTMSISTAFLGRGMYGGTTVNEIILIASTITATERQNLETNQSNYYVKPTISSFTPSPAASGNTVTVTGTNFNGASAVSFGGTPATSFTVVNATTITAVVAGGANGSVSVTTPGGTASLAGFAYLNTLNNIGLTSSTPAVVAYSLRKLSSNYSGSAVKVRRSSDNAEADVAFDASGIISATSVVTITAAGTSGLTLNSTQAFSTFFASTDCYVKTLYDQSGNSYHATQATTGNQPQIVASGVITTSSFLNNKPSLTFDATAQRYMTIPVAATVINATGTFATVHSQGTLQTGFNAILAWTSSGSVFGPGFAPLTSSGAFGLYTTFGSNSFLDMGPIVSNKGYVMNAAWTGNGGSITASRNGTVVTGSVPQHFVSTVGNGFIGIDNGTAFTGSVPEIIVFAYALGSTDRQAMENNQIAFYTPAVITAGTVSGSIAACAGTASASPSVQQFTVSGNYLTGNITATAPAGFEISTTLGSGYASSLTFTQSAGVVNSKTVYVRSATSASAGSISGNVVLSSATATSVNIAVTGTVNALPIATAGSNSPVTTGNPLTLSSSGGTSYSWAGPNSFTSSLQGPSFTTTGVVNAGTYTVTVTNANGCVSTATTKVVINAAGPVGINSGITMWLDASDIDADATAGNDPANNTGLAIWKDKSGLAHNATKYSGQNNITYLTNQINGKSVAHFTRVNDALGSVLEATGVDIRATANPAITMFTVYKQGTHVNDGGQGQSLWGNDNGNWDRFFYNSWSFSNDGIVSLGTVNPTFVAVTGAGNTGVTQLMTAVYNNGVLNGSNIYFNGAVVNTFTDNTDPTAAQTDLRIGWDGDNGTFNGDIAEFIVYNRKLTDCEIQQVNQYLAAKYGVSFTSATISPAGTNAICQGGSLTLTASAGTSYQWYKDGTTIPSATASTYSATQSGTYTVAIVNAAGCSATSVGTVVNVNPLPVMTAGSNSPVIVGATLNLTSAGANTYSWSGPSFTSTLQNPTITNITSAASGVYTVIGTSTANCTATTSTTVVVNTPAGALNFDGVNDYVTVADNNTLDFGSGDFTVESWTRKLSSTNAYLNSGVVGKWNTGGRPGTNEWLLNNSSDGNNNVPSFLIESGNTIYSVAGTTNMNLGTWYHLAAVRRGTSLILYLNGVQEGLITIPANTVVNNVNMDMYLAAFRFNSAGESVIYSNIDMDELRIWKRSLCKEEVVNDMNCETPSNLTGLMAYYKFNQGNVNANNTTTKTLTDASVNNNTGILSATFGLTGTTSNWIAGKVTGNCSVFVAPTAAITGTTSVCVNATTNLANSITGGTWSSTNTNVATVSATGIVSGLAAGSSVITYTTLCGGVSTATVTVNALPTTTITAGSATTFCSGGSVTLTASNGSSYLWSNGATTQIITTSTAGSYSVTITNSNNCSAVSAATIVTVNPTPTVSVSASATSICSGSSTILTATGAQTYLWMPGSLSGASISVSPSANTTYTVSGTSAAGCSSGADWKIIKAGGNHSLAIKANGTLWASGFNGYGQLGNGSTTNNSSFTQIGNATWTAIAGGNYHSLGIQANSTLWAWGYNSDGELGNGNNTNTNIPQQIGNATWSSIATGASHSLGIKTDGTLWAWGSNNYGQIGNGSTINVNSPVQIGSSTWIKIAGGEDFSFGIKTDGTLWAWGHNNYYQLGLGNNTAVISSPVQISSSTWTNIAAGQSFGLGIKTDGTLWSWGYAYEGALGQGAVNPSPNPTQVGSASWSKIAASYRHSIGIRTDNTLYSWGYNANGQLGNGGTANLNTPTQVGTDFWADIAAGNNSGMGIKTPGTLWAWGYNGSGQFGIGNTTSSNSPVQSGIIPISITITVNALPTATVSGSRSVCQNATQPSITFTGSNAIAPYTFTYTINGGAQQTIVSSGNTAILPVSTATAGTFIYSLVSVKDASSTLCSASVSGSATVTVNALPSATVSGSVSVCQNATQPLISFTGSNATAPYTFTYTINGAAQQTVISTGNTATVSVPTTIAGTFTYALVSVKDASSTLCSASASGSATITVNALPTATVSGSMSVCRNASQPLISFTGSNATAPYTFTYTINGGAQQTVISNGNTATLSVPTTTAGTFTYALVSVKDASTTLCSNTASGSATVTVNSLPIFTACPSNLSVNNIANQCNAVVSYTATASGIPLPTLTYTFSGATTRNGSGTGSGQSFNAGVTTVTVTATNSCGSAICSFTVTVTDNEKPLITTNGNQSVRNDAGTCGATVMVSANATDNCNVINPTGARSDELQLTDPYPVGTTIITWIATDASGNTASASQTITVIDSESPVVVAKDVTVYLDATGHATVTAEQVDNGSSDNCGIATRTLSKTNFDCSNTNSSKPNISALSFDGVDDWVQVGGTIPGGNTFTFSAWFYPTDGNNGKIISSNSLEICVCGGGIQVYTPIGDAFGSFGLSMNTWHHIAVVFNSTLATVYMDGQEAFTFSMNGQLDPLSNTRFGAHTFVDCCRFPGSMDEISTWNVALSQSDITNLQTHSLTGSEPGITGYWNFDENGGSTALDHSGNGHTGTLTNMEGNPWITATAPVSGNSGGSATTLTVTDIHGNQSSATVNVTVLDQIAPVITCPSDITATATSAAGAVVTYTAPVGTDNCSATTARITALASGSTFPIGTTTVTHRATDASGNFTDCSFKVTVAGLAPVINCPSNISLSATAGLCGANVPFASTETTGIPASTITYSVAPGSFFSVGSKTITATATNAVGSSSCTFTVTVTDTQFPVLVGVPANTTVECDAVPAAATVTATDNCTTSVPTFTQTRTDGNCANNYTLTRTWSTTDASGNNTTQSQVITVQDTKAPVLAVPEDISVPNDNNVCGATVRFAATATDNCSTPTITYSQNPGTVFAIGRTVVTVTAKDACGNPTVKSFTVTVTDTQFPVLVGVPANATVECDAVPAAATVTATDNCTTSVPTFTQTRTDGNCVNNYTLTRTWSTTDASGNNTTQSQIITVQDTQAPVLTVPGDISVPNDNNVCGATVRFAATASDNCSTPTISYSQNPGTVFAIGKTVVTVTAKDACGNPTVKSFTVTVTDTQFPVLVGVPANATVECDAVPVAAIVTATDNCSTTVPTFTETRADGNCTNNYTLTRTWSTTDASENNTTQSQIITVQDTKAPVLTVPADISVSNDNNVCGATVRFAATASDNCSTPTISYSQNPGTVFAIGRTVVTVTATDACGNPTVKTFTVTVIDTQFPVLVGVPANATVECDAVPAAAIVTATDNCTTSIPTFTQTRTDGSCVNNYTLTRTWSTTDASGNNTTQSQIITVQDTQAPVLTVPADISVNNDNNVCGATVRFTATATDNCSTPTITYSQNPGTVFAIGKTVVTVTAKDACGNPTVKSFTVTVTDTQFPVLVGVPANATVECDAVPVAAIVTATDNCSTTVPTFTETRADGNCTNNYTLTRTWSTTDASGNNTTQSQIITVQDTKAPVLTMPADISVPNDNNVCGATVRFAATASDNCSTPTITYSQNPGTVFAIGRTVVTVTATDACGNPTVKSFTITVTDTQFPVLVGVPANATVECDAVPVAAIVTATDNCSTTVPTFTQTRTDGNCINNYTLTRTWSTTDASGNNTTQSQIITVQDTKAPVLTVPADISVSNDNNVCGATVRFAATATDNCSTPTITYSQNPGTVFAIGKTVVTVTAKDACGNPTVKSFTVTVKDTQFPVLVGVPANATVECDAVPAAATVTATDNCTTSVPIFTQTRTEGNCANNYTLTRTWSTTDASGNTTTATQVITVQDTKAPALTVPADISVPNDNNVCGATVRFAATATDNCSIPTITYSQNPGTVFAIGTTVVTVTAKDACGNPTVKSFTVTVTDTQFPVLVGVPANTTVECDAVPAAAIVTATDNCSTAVPTFTQTRTDGNCVNNYTLTRTWSTKDASGNTTTTTQVITVQDTKAPVLTMPADISVPNDNNVCGATVRFAATATDNCSSPTITYSQNPGTVFAIGTTIVTVTAKDACGNPTVKSFTVTVKDTQFPVLVGVPANATVECDAVPAAATVTATDNCTTSVPTFTQTRTDGSCVNNYTLTRTWSTKDASGNTTTATQVITVQDTQAPVLSAAPDNVTVECNAVPAAVVLSVTDNCSTPTVVYTQASTQNASVNNAGYYNYILTRTWTATDACGNTSSKVQVITVQDKTKPVIVSCPSNVTQCNDQSGNIRSFTFVATDNCSPLTTTYSITAPNGSIVNGTGNTITTGFAIGTTTITWTVKDVSGNTNSCVTSITVNALPMASITAANADAFCNKFVITGSSTLTGPFFYQWSYNNIAVGSAQQLSLDGTNGDGVYTLYTKDVNGCRSASGATYNYQKQNLISSYTIIAYKEVELGENNKVNSGSVGVLSSKGEAEFKKYSSVASPGSFVKAVKIDKESNATILMPIYAAATPSLPTMVYNTSSTKSLPNYEVKSGTVILNGNYGNLTIKKGSVVTLTGTTFGTIHTEEGAQLTFTQSTINIDELKLDKGPQTGYTYVHFAPNTKVLVSRSVSIGDQVYLNPDNYKVTFYVGSLQDTKKGDDDWSDDAKFSVNGKDVKVTVNVMMPAGKLKVNGGDEDNDGKKPSTYINMTGLFIGVEVESEAKNVIWNSFDCSAPPSAPIVSVSSTPLIQTASVATAEKTVSTEEELKVTVMPNPSTSYFTLKLESKYETPVNLRVMDGRGRVVDAKSQIGANSTFQIGHNYSSGTYYAELIQGTKRKVVQLIKGRG